MASKAENISMDRTALDVKCSSVSFFPGDTPDEKRFRKILFFISIAALILRGIAAFEMACAGNGINNMLAPLPTSDLATYMRLGKDISQGKLPEVFYYQPFYYAVFLPVIYFICGKFSILAVIAVQTLLSSATVYLAGMCGEKVFNRRAGIIAAAAAAISSPLILYVPYHQNETLHCYLLTLLTFLSLRAVEKCRIRDWIFAGLVAGVAILNRGNINLLLPVLFAALVFSCRRAGQNWKSVGIKALLMLLCIVVVQLPFIVYNSAALNRFSGPSTAANAVLALGNTVEAPAGGRDPGMPAGAMYYPVAYHRAMACTVGAFPVSMGEQMWEFFCDEPLAFCELQFRKALLFWDGREIPNNVSLEHDGFSSRLLRYLYPGRSVVLLTFALAGVFWFIPRLKQKELKLWMLYGFVICFWAAVTLFYMLSRFRAPVLPLLFIFGGGFVDEAYCRIKEVNGRMRRLTVGKLLIVLLVAFGFVFSFYDSYRSYWEAAVNRFIRPDGIKLDQGGSDIHIFDHGPAPFGGWKEIPAKAGMKLYKKFAGAGNENGLLYFSVSNVEKAHITFSCNGSYQTVEFPELRPGKSPRKGSVVPVQLFDGAVQMEILSCSGNVAFICDTQRDYGRSALNGEIMPAEWVFRFGRHR